MNQSPQNTPLSDIERYKEHVSWLEATVDNLREENEALNSELLRVQKELDALIPLRRHIKKQARHHLGRLDRKVIAKLSRQGNFKPVKTIPAVDEQASLLEQAASYDKKNFASYAKSSKPHATLPAYLSSRQNFLKAARRLKKAVGK